MAKLKLYRMQLVDSVTNEAITTSGGRAFVARQGDAEKLSVFTEAGAPAANPVVLTNGLISFYVAEEVNAVDLYIQAPSGHGVILKNYVPSGDNSIRIDRARLDTVLVIPFSIRNTTADTETDTSFDVPLRAAVVPVGLFVDVLTLEAARTINVGVLSSETGGDADGFIAGISLAAASPIKATLTNAALTLGALLFVQDSANAGDEVPEVNFLGTGRSISYTLSASTALAEGFICIPMVLSPRAF